MLVMIVTTIMEVAMVTTTKLKLTLKMEMTMDIMTIEMKMNEKVQDGYESDNRDGDVDCD